MVAPNAANLSGIESLSLLESLHLAAPNASDLGALANMRLLRALTMQGSQVANVAPLAGLRFLSFVDLYGSSQLSDLSPFGTMASLSDLCIVSSAVTDFSALIDNADFGEHDFLGIYEAGLGDEQLADLARLEARGVEFHGCGDTP